MSIPFNDNGVGQFPGTTQLIERLCIVKLEINRQIAFQSTHGIVLIDNLFGFAEAPEEEIQGMDSVIIQRTARNQLFFKAIPRHRRPIGGEAFIDGDDGAVTKEAAPYQLASLSPRRVKTIGMAHTNRQIIRSAFEYGLSFSTRRGKRFLTQYVLSCSNAVLENSIPHMWRSANDTSIT